MLSAEQIINDGFTFKVEIAGGTLFIYGDGIEYHIGNDEGDCDCWSKLNWVEPEVWVEVYPVALALYDELNGMTEAEQLEWLANFKTDADFEIL